MQALPRLGAVAINDAMMMMVDDCLPFTLPADWNDVWA